MSDRTPTLTLTESGHVQVPGIPADRVGRTPQLGFSADNSFSIPAIPGRTSDGVGPNSATVRLAYDNGPAPRRAQGGESVDGNL